MADKRLSQRRLRGIQWGGFLRKRTSGPDPLLPVTELLRGQNPPSGLLCKIEQQIDALGEKQLDPQRRLAGDLRLRTGLPGFSLGLLSGALASVLLLSVVPDRMGIEGNPTPVAAMAGPAGAVVVEADSMGNRHYLIVEFQPMTQKKGGAVELWAISGKGAAPRSLGLLTQKGPVTILALEKNLQAGDVLALSREPIGGSPEPGPTGPVLMTAEIR